MPQMDNQFHSQDSDLETAKDNQKGSNLDSDVFTRHNDSVLCCSIDNTTRLAVTGGIDDTAFVWDLNTRHVIFECLGHKESVVAAAFSHNSTYVATGDLNGYIQVRNTTTGIKVFDFEIDEINWITWHNESDYVLLAGTTKGDFWMWNVNDPGAVKTFASYGSSSTAARLLSDGLRLIVSYHDGSIRMFDLKTRQSVLHHSDSSKSEIICMDLNMTKSILAIGCIDSSVKLFTLANLKLIGTMHCKTPEGSRCASGDNHLGNSIGRKVDGQEPMDDDAAKDDIDDSVVNITSDSIEIIDDYTDTAGVSELGVEEDEDDEDDDLDYDRNDDYNDDFESVETVAFSPCGNFLAAANNSGTIVMWDVSTQTKRSEIHTGVGVTGAAWTRDGLYVAGHLDGTIRMYNSNSTELRKIVAHQDQILDLASKDNIVVTASEDKTSRVVKL